MEILWNIETLRAGIMENLCTMEGPLSKWTNLVNGWQYRWFVLDFSVGVLSYYTSKEKMMRGDRRGCVKLKNAQVGIDDVDDSTFTITVDHKTFHFQARDSEERQKWLDALQEARDLHTQNYALLNQTHRLLEHPYCLSEFDRRIVEADAYLQILIDQHEQLTSQLSTYDECKPEVMEAVTGRMQKLIELVKKTIVCLQFARGSVSGSYGAIYPSFCASELDTSQQSDNNLKQNVENACESPPFTSNGSCVNTVPKIQSSSNSLSEGRTAKSTSLSHCHVHNLGGEGDAGNQFHSCSPSISAHSSGNASDHITVHPERVVQAKRSSSTIVTSFNCHTNVNDSPCEMNFSCSLPSDTIDYESNCTPLNPDALSTPIMPLRSYSSSDDDDNNNNNQNQHQHPHSKWELESQHIRSDEDDEFFDTQEDIFTNSSNMPFVDNLTVRSNSSLSGRLVPIQCSINNQSNVSRHDSFDELYDDDTEEDIGSVQSHGSVITHLLSQLRIGMDLTRITLPTFILERRSSLEMYADFLSHSDLWSTISDGANPRDRMVACLRWYLSAFHAGRKSSVAKKPYNPTLGEIFRCYWHLGDKINDESRNQSLSPGFHNLLLRSGPVPWAPDNAVIFLAEQVSHHPPISAFYAEHIGKRITVDGHLWTKSKFLGLSISVEMVGSATICLIDHDEEYVIRFPAGFGRNILSMPWFELGGKTNIVCAKTGYVANIEFRTKPFYGGKKDAIRAEVLEPNERRPFLVVEGEWNNKMWAKWINGKNELFIDTHALPIIKKRVRPRAEQAENESRRLWEEVTYNLKLGNIDAASDAKVRLEQKQRDLARHRRETKQTWLPVYFQSDGDGWIYRHPLIQRLNTQTNSDQKFVLPNSADLTKANLQSHNSSGTCGPSQVSDYVICQSHTSNFAHTTNSSSNHNAASTISVDP